MNRVRSSLETSHKSYVQREDRKTENERNRPGKMCVSVTLMKRLPEQRQWVNRFDRRLALYVGITRAIEQQTPILSRLYEGYFKASCFPSVLRLADFFVAWKVFWSRYIWDSTVFSISDWIIPFDSYVLTGYTWTWRSGRRWIDRARELGHGEKPFALQNE